MSNNQKPHWIEVQFQLPKQDTETLNLQLEQLGSLGGYEKMGLDTEEEERRTLAEFIAYFSDQEIAQLQSKLTALETSSLTLKGIHRIPQAEWATEWKKYFKPFTLTKNIVIRPSWEEYQAQAGEVVVTLDPGMAFGTGQHDTTRFCSELICELKENHAELESLIDVGCGSGILSIIARKIGYQTVKGIDIDPHAIETAHENLERNPEAKPLTFLDTTGSLKSLENETYDVVVSNIIAETLCELKDDLVKLTKDTGYLILSGIMAPRESLVKDAFHDLELITERKSGEWHAYVYHRK